MKAIINTKDDRRKYKTICKTFNGKEHLNNYIKVLEKKGVKVIGIHYL